MPAAPTPKSAHDTFSILGKLILDLALKIDRLVDLDLAHNEALYSLDLLF